ncbi:MAG: glycosyl hydrolase [Acidobacteria bacterium]|nr:glycosyl hydrolase [Acidobacteriota bacterium]
MSPAETTAQEWAARAQAAAQSVTTNFGHRLAGIPGTWIAAVRHPEHPSWKPWAEWHYWWQAHYLDALVDSAWRQATSTGNTSNTAGPAADAQCGAELTRAKEILRGIRIRNFLRLVNNYYDDMAWLALAAGRMETLSSTRTTAGSRSARAAMAVLSRQLDYARTDELGGGLFWSKKRDFKNTPATAPAALFFARAGGEANRTTAQALVDWLHQSLFDAELGLYLDGIKIRASGTEVERGIYTYNQGPILGALLELGGTENLRRAAALIGSVAKHLRDGEGGPLTLHGTGDGGLFTGILVRYLSVAARRRALEPQSRRLAQELVLETAQSLWLGRAEEPLRFGASHNVEAAQTYPPGAAVELSTQLQAWMTFECAYQVVQSVNMHQGTQTK